MIWLVADLISYVLTGRATLMFPMLLLLGVGCFWELPEASPVHLAGRVPGLRKSQVIAAA